MLLDTLLVRSVIVPALALALDVGKRIWWPSRLANTDGQEHVCGHSTKTVVAEPALIHDHEAASRK